MTTAQYAIVVSGIVGVCGVFSPAVTSWRQRKFDREEARAARLHGQRLDLYRELGEFLELERMRLERIEADVKYNPPLEPPGYATDQEWARLTGNARVAGSEEARAALDTYHSAASTWVAKLGIYRMMQQQYGPGEETAEALKEMREAREAAFKPLDEAERVMNAELIRL